MHEWSVRLVLHPYLFVLPAVRTPHWRAGLNLTNDTQGSLVADCPCTSHIIRGKCRVEDREGSVQGVSYVCEVSDNNSTQFHRLLSIFIKTCILVDQTTQIPKIVGTHFVIGIPSLMDQMYSKTDQIYSTWSTFGPTFGGELDMFLKEIEQKSELLRCSPINYLSIGGRNFELGLKL